jgi:hypothetical protein
MPKSVISITVMILTVYLPTLYLRARKPAHGDGSSKRAGAPARVREEAPAVVGLLLLSVILFVLGGDGL